MLLLAASRRNMLLLAASWKNMLLLAASWKNMLLLAASRRNMIHYFFYLGVLLSVAVSDPFEARIKFQPPLNPVLLIPGIGGSILYADVPDNPGRRVWISSNDSEKYAEYLVGFSNNVYTKYDDNGLESINILDGSEVEYFSTIIKYFKDIGYQSGINLFGHPYDWRQSIYNISLDKRLDYIIREYQPIIISHSMGGLVVQQYIRKNGDSNIRAWIGISTPLRGIAGQALNSFINGYNLGNQFISSELAKRIAIESYSSYELLPKDTINPTITIDSDQQFWLQALSLLPYFKKERLDNNFDPVFARKTYYITNSAVYTPFNYYQENDEHWFSAVPGDGIIPYSSMSNLKGDEHNLNDPGLSHIAMLHSMKLISLLFRFTDNECIEDGTYYNGNDSIIIRDGIAGISNYTISLSCLIITYNGKEYIRDIGTSCSKYSVETKITDFGALIVECVYGNIFTSEIICDTNLHYDIITHDCIVNPPTANTTGGIIVIVVLFSLFIVFIFIGFTIKLWHIWRINKLGIDMEPLISN